MAAGEVLLNGTQLGTVGNQTGYPLSNLFDGNNQTAWSTFGVSGASTPWAGIDAGTSCTLTRLRVSAWGGHEDLAIGATLQASSSSGFPGLPTGVQGNFNSSNSAGNISCPFNSSNTAGNCLVAFVETTGSTPSVSDSVNGSYGSAVGQATGFLYCFVFPNCGSGANTVTATCPANTFASLQIIEFSGCATSSVVDSTATNSGSSGTTASVNITQNNVNEMIVAGIVSGFTDTFTAGSGYIKVTSYFIGHASGAANFGACTIDAFSSSTGTQTPSCSFTVSGNWWIVAIALKPGSLSPTILSTISSRLVPGTLLNEFDVSPSTQYRYYRYQSPTNSLGTISDLDFIASYTPGITAQCCTPTITPPGGDYDQPIIVRLSSITTDAAFYYTTNGSTPTTGSPQYTGPFVINSSCTLQVLGTSPNVSTSRIASAIFHIPSAFVSTDVMRDNRNYPMGFQSIDPVYFHDPVGGYWWLYGANEDEAGVVNNGYIGVNIYYSSDLRNWIYSGIMGGPSAGTANGTTNNSYFSRPYVVYNAANNNYVMWLSGSVDLVFTSANPAGPWTQVASYTTLNGISSVGDHCIFIDPNDGLGGVTAYRVWDSLSSTQLVISKLNSSYTNVDGVNFVTYPNNTSSPFGQPGEANTMFYSSGHYFWMTSNQKNWTPTLNKCVSNTTGPLGSWGASFNPFSNVAITPTAAEIAVGVTPSFTNAYDSQTAFCLQISGRNAFIYVGDRYLTGLPSSSGSSPTANFLNYNRITIPFVLTAGVAALTWNDNWTLDATFPTISGAPLAPTSLNVGIQNIATWTNNEPNPCNLYLDCADDALFTTNVKSEVVTSGSASFQINVTGNYYRVRAVNASGTSNSISYPLPPIPSPPGSPPYTPPWYLVPPQSPPYIPPSASPSSTSPSVAGYYIVYDSSGAFIIMYLIPGVDYGPNGLWFQGQIQSIHSGPYADYFAAVPFLRTLPSVFNKGPNP
jgi:Chitobiase/beta-hexosaminidase C-terminal domain